MIRSDPDMVGPTMGGSNRPAAAITDSDGVLRPGPATVSRSHLDMVQRDVLQRGPVVCSADEMRMVALCVTLFADDFDEWWMHMNNMRFMPIVAWAQDDGAGDGAAAQSSLEPPYHLHSDNDAISIAHHIPVMCERCGQEVVTTALLSRMDTGRREAASMESGHRHPAFDKMVLATRRLRHLYEVVVNNENFHVRGRIKYRRRRRRTKDDGGGGGGPSGVAAFSGDITSSHFASVPSVGVLRALYMATLDLFDILRFRDASGAGIVHYLVDSCIVRPSTVVSGDGVYSGSCAQCVDKSDESLHGLFDRFLQRRCRRVGKVVSILASFCQDVGGADGGGGGGANPILHILSTYGILYCTSLHRPTLSTVCDGNGNGPAVVVAGNDGPDHEAGKSSPSSGASAITVADIVSPVVEMLLQCLRSFAMCQPLDFITVRDPHGNGLLHHVAMFNIYGRSFIGDCLYPAVMYCVRSSLHKDFSGDSDHGGERSRMEAHEECLRVLMEPNLYGETPLHIVSCDERTTDRFVDSVINRCFSSCVTGGSRVLASICSSAMHYGVLMLNARLVDFAVSAIEAANAQCRSRGGRSGDGDGAVTMGHGVYDMTPYECVYAIYHSRTRNMFYQSSNAIEYVMGRKVVSSHARPRIQEIRVDMGLDHIVYNIAFVERVCAHNSGSVSGRDVYTMNVGKMSISGSGSVSVMAAAAPGVSSPSGTVRQDWSLFRPVNTTYDNGGIMYVLGFVVDICGNFAAAALSPPETGDIVINNDGVIYPGTLAEETDDDGNWEPHVVWRRTMSRMNHRYLVLDVKRLAIDKGGGSGSGDRGRVDDTPVATFMPRLTCVDSASGGEFNTKWARVVSILQNHDAGPSAPSSSHSMLSTVAQIYSDNGNRLANLVAFESASGGGVCNDGNVVATLEESNVNGVCNDSGDDDGGGGGGDGGHCEHHHHYSRVVLGSARVSGYIARHFSNVFLDRTRRLVAMCLRYRTTGSRRGVCHGRGTFRDPSGDCPHPLVEVARTTQKLFGRHCGGGGAVDQVQHAVPPPPQSDVWRGDSNSGIDFRDRVVSYIRDWELGRHVTAADAALHVVMASGMEYVVRVAHHYVSAFRQQCATATNSAAAAAAADAIGTRAVDGGRVSTSGAWSPVPEFTFLGRLMSTMGKLSSDGGDKWDSNGGERVNGAAVPSTHDAMQALMRFCHVACAYRVAFPGTQVPHGVVKSMFESISEAGVPIGVAIAGAAAQRRSAVSARDRVQLATFARHAVSIIVMEQVGMAVSSKSLYGYPELPTMRHQRHRRGGMAWAWAANLRRQGTSAALVGEGFTHVEFRVPGGGMGWECKQWIERASGAPSVDSLHRLAMNHAVRAVRIVTMRILKECASGLDTAGVATTGRQRRSK